MTDLQNNLIEEIKFMRKKLAAWKICFDLCMEDLDKKLGEHPDNDNLIELIEASQNYFASYQTIRIDPSYRIRYMELFGATDSEFRKIIDEIDKEATEEILKEDIDIERAVRPTLPRIQEYTYKKK